MNKIVFFVVFTFLIGALYLIPSKKSPENLGTVLTPTPTLIVPASIDCTSESRMPEVCADIYAPVCAKVNVQCIKAPCDPIQQTYSNACEACKNSLVESYNEGECEAN